jgi:hypothetical protein
VKVSVHAYDATAGHCTVLLCTAAATVPQLLHEIAAVLQQQLYPLLLQLLVQVFTLSRAACEQISALKQCLYVRMSVCVRVHIVSQMITQLHLTAPKQCVI